MNRHALPAIVLAVAAVIGTSTAFSEEPVFPTELAVIRAPSQKQITQPRSTHVLPPAIETDSSASESGTWGLTSAMTAAAGSTLTPPVTITYNGSSNAVTIKDGGTGRGLSASVTNSANSNSAVYGESAGKGAGVKGINYGTGGPGGLFQVTDAASSQPALAAVTNAKGSAIVAQVTGSSNSDSPAIVGQNQILGLGIGVQGIGGDVGVSGLGGGIGVYGSGGIGVEGFATDNSGVIGESNTAEGVRGSSDSGNGVYGASTTAVGVYGYSDNSDGVYANSNHSQGLVAHSYNALALYASSDASYGIWGQSRNQYGVIGEDSGSGIGVYGYSASGYAGYFAGKLGATSFVTLSDRNAKTAFKAVDGSDILERIAQLPVSSWTFKGDASRRHVGPMAQDFHAAFGLNGDDDTHINLSDAAGVSLAAIQELTKRLKEKDQEIAELKAMNAQVSARMAKLEERIASPGTMTTNLRVREVRN